MKRRIMEINELEAIESLGYLLAYYKSHLEYISKFNLFKNKQIKLDDYYEDKNYGFQEFLKEFKVIRNIRKSKKKDLLKFIKDSILQDKTWTVDTFAEEMRNRRLTQKKNVMTVLASKIFFLNRPDIIIPMDKFNKKSLGLRKNKYNDFLIKINKFKKENSIALSKYLNHVKKYLITVENRIKINIDFEKYRINRLTDIYLWVDGQNYKPNKRI